MEVDLEKNLGMDLPYFLRLKAVTEAARMRKKKALMKVAVVLYEALQFELGLAGIAIPARMNVVCSVHHAFVGYDGCKKCMEKLYQKPKKHHYGVFSEVEGRIIAQVSGETIPEAIGEFGALAWRKGFRIWRGSAEDYVYENEKGQKIYTKKLESRKNETTNKPTRK